MLLLLLACTGEPKDTGEETPFDGNFALSDANNYAYTSALAPGAQDVALRSDFTVDWSGLTTDLLGHATDPATDIEYVWMIQFPNRTEEELVDLLVGDALLQEDIGAVVQFSNGDGRTSASLSEFVFPPNAPIDPADDFTDGSGAWILRGTTGLLTTRMLSFVRPSDTTTNTALTLTSTSAALDFDADLASLGKYAFDEELDAYTVDWSGLTKHAGGADIDLSRIDQLLLARYDGLSVAELEAQFLDIELIASVTYTADIYGLTSIDLSTVTDVGGAPFAGFGADTRWLLALRCTTCANPSPPFLTVIEVGAP
jgi:hypothetical protein